MERLIEGVRDLSPTTIGLIGLVVLLGASALGFVRPDFPVTGAIGRWWNQRPVRAAEKAAAAAAAGTVVDDDAQPPEIEPPDPVPEPPPATPMASDPWAIDIDDAERQSEPLAFEPEAEPAEPEPATIEAAGIEPDPEPIVEQPTIEQPAIEEPAVEAPDPVVAGGISAMVAAAAAAQSQDNGEADPEVDAEPTPFPPTNEPMPVAELPADPFDVGSASAVAVAPEMAQTRSAEPEEGTGEKTAKGKQPKPARVDRPTLGERMLGRVEQSSLGRWWMRTEWGETMRVNAEGKRLQEAIEERRRTEGEDAD
jgi:hypothetical protein